MASTTRMVKAAIGRAPLTALAKPYTSRKAALRVKLPTLAPLALVWLLAVDVLTGVPAGPLSASGALTLAGAALCLLLWPMLMVGRHRGTPLALSLFMGYALLRLLTSPTPEGIQNVAVYVTFIITIELTAAMITPDAASTIGARTRLIGVIASAAFLVSAFAGVALYGPRSFALAGLIYLAALIPHQPAGGIARLAPFLVAAAIVASLSRTASFIALLLLVFLSVRGKRGFRLLKSSMIAGVAAVLAYWLITYYQPFRERFEVGDGASLEGIQMNTSGRSALWDVTLRSALESPLFGKGAGSASELITSTFGTISHPHNDYLRLLHDFGLVGLVLFVLGMLQVLVRVWRRAAKSNNSLHWTAVLGTLAVLIACTTDNVIVYPFVMVPLGLLLGVSLGLPSESIDRTGGSLARRLGWPALVPASPFPRQTRNRRMLNGPRMVGVGPRCVNDGGHPQLSPRNHPASAPCPGGTPAGHASQELGES